MRILIAILFITCSTLAFADVDCSQQQQSVNQLIEQIASANLVLNKATSDLDKCNTVNNVIKSDEYKSAVEANKAKDNALKNYVRSESGTNWSDLNVISNAVVNP